MDHHLSSDDPEFTALYQYTYPGSDNTILLAPQDRDTISLAVKARVFRMVHK
nr:MAG TPA: Sld7 C-terminal domain [Caudoviricetes sp.]